MKNTPATPDTLSNPQRITKQAYTYQGLQVFPIAETLRTVPGGRCVDIRISDSRSTITYATVNVANVRDRYRVG